jgi:hypothetical protein
MTYSWDYSEEFSPDDYLGFVYIIENKLNNKKYIGKKYFRYKRKKKKTKKELAETKGKGRPSLFNEVITESDWENYYGSNKQLKEDLKKLGPQNFTRTIIKLCKTKKELTYWETKYIFVNSCLEQPEKWYNDTILGKFYSCDLNERTTAS